MKKKNESTAENMVQSLTRLVSGKEVGNLILAEAQEKMKERHKEKVVGFVISTMDSIRDLSARISMLQDEKEIHVKRLEAIEKGNFMVNELGRLIFNDRDIAL